MAAGIKRKQVSESTKSANGFKVKKVKVAEQKSAKKSKSKAKPVVESDVSMESDTSEVENGFSGFSAKEDDSNSSAESEDEEDAGRRAEAVKKVKTEKKAAMKPQQDAFSSSSSREAHAKQKALSKERKAAKPNADEIARSKKLWERLRLKSHVDLEERKRLVAELFDIVTGRVKDFVFKHDSVRVVQCALKYANKEQKKMIAEELRGEYRALAESKYAKFLIAKLLVTGDAGIQEMIVSEFYGHVRRLINHPEAAWIMDDTYRSVATSEQKATMLREWYGPEFAIFKSKSGAKVTSDLSTILDESPEKRQPILNYLNQLINQLVQKKLTGFTMLHDAMLQYFLACKPGSTEASEFLDHLKPEATKDKEADQPPEIDLLRNLAFTESGSRLVCLAFAHSNAKDRKNLLRAYRENMEALVFDRNAHRVLLAALSVIDDTKLSSTAIFGELIPKSNDADAVNEKIFQLVTHLDARTVLLYPFAADAKWLFSDPKSPTIALLNEVHAIRATTSKKNPETRLQELAKSISPPLLGAITARAADFATSSFGCQFMIEVLFDAEGDKELALGAVAQLAAGDPSVETHISNSAAGCRMLKGLVLSGKYDPKQKKVIPVEPSLGFAEKLWDSIQDHLMDWATGPGSFVVVGLVEAQGFEKRDEVVAALEERKKKLESAAGKAGESEKKDKKNKGTKKEEESKDKKRKGDQDEGAVKGNAGARILLKLIT
ncbi:ARM repeat-containing protein [Lophium mytilinum]|uniref:ARM repeat-containing protein n=1 Tax=Lophium mytilinum TaxID=390894 RepID=A0A6A6QUL4_9PEZI|nr:ARM repeat-containing protein [Lophium mytilinum]